MLTVNLLHEFELGVFKSVFKHLLRLLYAIDPNTVAILDDQCVPVVSKPTIDLKRDFLQAFIE